MTKTICDICGEEMPTTKHIDNIENLNFCISSHGKIWDICNECRVSLSEWILMRKQKVENKSEQIDVEFNHEAFYEFLLNTINPNEMENYRSMFLSNGEIVK